MGKYTRSSVHLGSLFVRLHPSERKTKKKKSKTACQTASCSRWPMRCGRAEMTKRDVDQGAKCWTRLVTPLCQASGCNPYVIIRRSGTPYSVPRYLIQVTGGRVYAEHHPKSTERGVGRFTKTVRTTTTARHNDGHKITA